MPLAADSGQRHPRHAGEGCGSCMARWQETKMSRHPSLSGKIEIFWSQVNKTKSCWLWTGRITNKGYGISARINGEVRAHRVAWTLTDGPTPKGLNVLHQCDVRNCVRHLFLGTIADNQQDAKLKGRLRSTKLLQARSNHEYRKQVSAQMRKLWSTDEYRKMQMRARGLS